MEKEHLFNKIKGTFIVAGMGDALGAPSEAWSRDEIIKQFGGLITDFVDPSPNIYVQDNLIGEVTDDTSQMYEMALAIIKSNGNFTVNDAAKALVDWSEKYPKYYPRNAGPTTRYVIEELKSGKDPVELGKMGGTYDRGTSNGAAMRIAPAGFLYPGDLEKTIEVAITMTKPSHGTQHAYSGACAIACGISNALMEDSDLFSIIKACLYGAKRGEEIGKQEARIASGFATYEKIIKSIEIALTSDNMNEAMDKLERYVGNDGSIQSTVGCAIGLFLAGSGDSMKTIIGGANIGGDTDTIACIAGMLAGAYNGLEGIDMDKYEVFINANPSLDFDKVSEELTNIAYNNYLTR
ncbi:ADP-ribosylglycohydrolase family protein [Neobacillus niacini]|uniref:ADP-ribosylglycohydrolase family protein n=1 Tax=Neobacillus niacini TaxID=86668 RepID=UPI00300368FD